MPVNHLTRIVNNAIILFAEVSDSEKEAVMDKLVYLDIASLILIVFLLVSTISRKMTMGRSNKAFLLLIATVMLAAAFNVVAVYTNATQNPNLDIRQFAHTGYLLFHNLTPLVYLMYSTTVTGETFFRKELIGLDIGLMLPITCVVGLLASNFVTHNLFYFDENLKYVRGKYFFVLYVSAALYAVAGLIYIFRFVKKMEPIKLIALASILPLTFAAMAVQALDSSARFEMFSNALSLIFISMTIQKPENTIDILTRLLNYPHYAETIKKNFTAGREFTEILINIANTSQVQELAGHDGYMTLLKHTSKVIENVNKRMHGKADLFYLDRGRFRMLFNAKNGEKAEAIAGSLNRELKQHITVNSRDITITAHICLAHCPEEIGDFNSLMTFGWDFHKTNAYTGEVVKASEIFEQKKFTILNNLHSIIEKGLKNKNFKVYYQPIYSVSQRRFVSAEALLRLIDDEYGFISPDLFIPAAERSGAIHRIGDFVLEEVCRFIASDDFKKLGVDYIEVNLSVAQCMHVGLAHKVMDILNKYKVSPEKINLEITETAISFSQKIMIDNILELNEAGISFSLDDYGTGYSNLKRVVQLPMKIVKLDKSFVDEHSNPKMRIVLKNTIRMLKDMDMEIVVEGIETSEMVDAFSELKCDFIQGYFFSKPIPEQDFVKFISERQSA